MFTELFRENNYNIKIANLFGLEAAVYLSAVQHQDGVNNIIEEGVDFIVLNREKIKDITTLSIESQRNIDKIFSDIGVFEFSSKDRLHMNYNMLLSIYNDANDSILKDMVPKITKKKTKADAIRDELRTLIKTDNSELRDAYSSWIEAVFAKQGWMSKKSVELGQKLIDEYCNRNLDTAIEILNIASISGYRDIQWAINSYEENKRKQISRVPVTLNKDFEVKKKIELAQEVF